MTLPDFAIIGAQKAGSTFVLETLRSHPRIFMPRNEIAYFEGSLFSAEQLGQFAEHFRSAPADRKIGFKRANLLGHPEAANRLKETLGPSLKCIAILRNPIDRAVSAYYHAAATGIIPAKSIEWGLPRILDGGIADYPRAGEIATFGLYGRHLAHYSDVFGRHQICAVLLDDIRSRLDEVFVQLFDFLEISTEFDRPDPERRPMAAPYSLLRIRMKRLIESPARKWSPDRHYFTFRQGPIWRYYLKAVRGIDHALLARLFARRAPRLSAPLFQQLSQYYEEDVRQLGKWLDRDLSHWLRRELPRPS